MHTQAERMEKKNVTLNEKAKETVVAKGQSFSHAMCLDHHHYNYHYFHHHHDHHYPHLHRRQYQLRVYQLDLLILHFLPLAPRPYAPFAVNASGFMCWQLPPARVLRAR